MHNRNKNKTLPVGAMLENWQKRPAPEHKLMQGRYCRVESLKPAVHAQQLYQAFAEDSDGIDWCYMSYGPFNDFEGFYQWLLGLCCKDDPLFFAIIDKHTSLAVGMASFLRMDSASGVIEVGHIHFSPHRQKTRMATEAMYLMMHHVFDELGYRRYEWKCDACNQGSKNAALRLGFQFEGIFRQAMVYKQRNRDTAWFSIIDKEWPAIKAALEGWLDVTNFDDQGLQKRTLRESY